MKPRELTLSGDCRLSTDLSSLKKPIDYKDMVIISKFEDCTVRLNEELREPYVNVNEKYGKQY